MTIYDRIKSLAVEKNKTIAAIESEAGVSNGTIAGWREGKPFAETLYKVAKVLGVSIETLLEEQ